jgi:hypothetical protein
MPNVESTRRAEERRTRRSRSLSWGTGAGVSLLALLVLVAPLTAGAHPATVTVKAPYQGSQDAGFDWVAQGCGFHISTPVSPAFNLTTGVGKLGVAASVKSCGSGESGLYSAAAVGLNSTTTFTTTTGSHTITVHWTFKYTVKLTATVGGPGQGAFAEGFVGAIATLYDSTAGTSTTIASYFTGNATSSGSFGATFTVKVTLSHALALVSGHVYQVETVAEVGLDVGVSPGTSSASATTNMGSSGDSAKLTSIIIP